MRNLLLPRLETASRERTLQIEPQRAQASDQIKSVGSDQDCWRLSGRHALNAFIKQHPLSRRIATVWPAGGRIKLRPTTDRFVAHLAVHC
jgi:hypothetical protein